LYDKTILTADRYSSSAGEWVIYGDRHFYTVTVTSRPVYALPQELCLAFDCVTQIEEGELPTGGTYHNARQPIEEIALDFVALLSVWAREPLVPLGVRRIDDRPITGRPHYVAPPRAPRSADPPPSGINSSDFCRVLKGMATSTEETVAAAVAASKFYHTALSAIAFDPSGAYVALVSAIECLAGHHYKDMTFNFREVENFER
jgi:hypothetical protein